MSVLNELLSFEMDYSGINTSFKPCYSNYSLCFDKNNGALSLALNYNRKSRFLWNSFVKIPGAVESLSQRIDGIKIKTSSAAFDISASGTDIYVLDISASDKVEIFADADDKLGDNWLEEKYSKNLLVRGYSANADSRDPDRFAPVMIGVKLLSGEFRYYKNGRIFIKPDADGRAYAVVCPEVFTPSADSIRKKYASAAKTTDEARETVKAWVKECVGDTLEMPRDPRAKDTFLRAVEGLIFNLTKAPGALAGRISAFPSRGGYPTHFLWDSAFQNLGYELMNPDIARDSVLQLTENIREDGRIAQFLCSTWQRPEYVQPALVGWMALRYLDTAKCNDKKLMKELFTALDANNKWWLNNRMTKFGLLFCEHGLETGQDDSPRFDDGCILALDMNSYLVSQMRCTAEIARRIGFAGRAKEWDASADRLARKMVEYLYDEETNMFYDAKADTAQKRPLLTTSAFIPLWCGVPLPEDRIMAMIKGNLLDPKRNFGKYPFPSVAYDQPEYISGGWWRGPTWMSEAWLMLEVLEKYGFEDEHREAMKRLYDMITEDGQLHELFDSQTGEGLYNAQQGWTAGTYIRLCSMLEA